MIYKLKNYPLSQVRADFENILNLLKEAQENNFTGYCLNEHICTAERGLENFIQELEREMEEMEKEPTICD